MVINYLISIVMILVGGWMLYLSYAPRLRSKRAVNWPTVEADILDTSVEENTIRSSTGKANIAFIPLVHYQYSVAGKTYEGDHITMTHAGYDFFDASNIRDQFTAGEKTTVHYNPSNPIESVLKPKATVGMFSRIPGFFITIVGLILFIYLVVNGG